MFSIVKPFLIAVVIIIIMFFLIGAIRIEKPEYGCFRGKEFRFDERVKLVDVGSFKVYGFPLVLDCPEEDRFDPDTVIPCGANMFCQEDNGQEDEI